MDKRKMQHQMYEVADVSTAQRFTLAVMAAVLVLFAWWLLAGRGIDTIGGWFGWPPQSGDAGRRWWLATGFTIYYVRLLFTQFVFLRRGVSWQEIFSIVPWLAIIILVLGIAGGVNRDGLGPVAWLGAVLFAVGSWMNSYAEYERHVWKQRTENRGQLYTGGLFRYSRHPNYLGDLVSFSGLCLVAGAWWTAVIPVVMLAGFVFVNIPVLDAHLHDHYGAAFDEYASRTRKLIPLVY